MAVNGEIIAPVDSWVDLTGGVAAKWMLCEVLGKTPTQCPGVWVRFQASPPADNATGGHELRPGPGNLRLGAQMDMLGGRAWAKSMSSVYAATLYVTAVDAT